jgi:thioredoxin-like negative regulator of GroEL
MADLYRQLGRAADGEAVLRTALGTSPRDAGLHYALGLALTRLKQTDAALADLRRATELDPDRVRYAYVYAVGLHSSGRRSEALALLKKTLAKHPNDRDTLMALISFSRDAGDAGSALAYARQLEQLAPDPQLTRLIEELQQRAAKPPAGSARIARASPPPCAPVAPTTAMIFLVAIRASWKLEAYPIISPRGAPCPPGPPGPVAPAAPPTAAASGPASRRSLSPHGRAHHGRPGTGSAGWKNRRAPTSGCRDHSSRPSTRSRDPPMAPAHAVAAHPTPYTMCSRPPSLPSSGRLFGVRSIGPDQSCVTATSARPG